MAIHGWYMQSPCRKVVREVLSLRSIFSFHHEDVTETIFLLTPLLHCSPSDFCLVVNGHSELGVKLRTERSDRAGA